MTHANLLFPICGQTTRLPEHLAQDALRLAGPYGAPDELDVERHLQCHLQVHETAHHFALVLDLAGTATGAIWTRWADDASPAALDTLPDCSHIDPESHEPCGEFAGHPGAHTYQLTTPPVVNP
ncbi:hypothetical protein GA0115240_139216 [Streptomyces sp. DvalAA-14]|nr:hypothetical protein GA0115240_139216 [Streptomyces sp. DvalAA-14]